MLNSIKNLVGLVSALSPLKSFHCLLALMGFLCGIGFLIFTVVFGITLFSAPVNNTSMCFDSACVTNFFNLFSGSFIVLEVLGEFLTLLVTIGGVLIALLNYLQSVESSTQSNSISHMNLFLSQVEREIAIKERLSPHSFDLFVWYDLAFSDAGNGRKTLSQRYVDALGQINAEIEKTNGERKDERLRLDLIDHQTRLKKALRPLGITITSHPKNDYLVIEDQILDLITRINRSFCNARYTKIQLFARDYR
ncbi:hypothetical protein C84B14_12998 [Salinisphaera sp. C84B14]|uniref:retron Ec48 family effector membrane protein n=1 Tax=Salinisphaera sp. C84B14 TaxID=1304155 RepID=UPI003341BC85